MAVSQPEKSTLDIGSLLTEGTQLIGGEWVPARGGETIAVAQTRRPERRSHDVPRCAEADVDDAVAAAAGAFPGWRDTSPECARAATAALGRPMPRACRPSWTCSSALEVG